MQKFNDKKLRLLEALFSLSRVLFITKIAWGVTGLIGILGFLLSVIYGDWSVFSRSGSLIVVCALLLALVDYATSTKEFINKTKEFLGPSYEEEEKGRIRQLIRDELDKYGLSKSEKEIAYLADQKREFYWDKFPERFGGSLKMKSVVSEVSIAMVGTLIWGFGDLFGKL